MKTLYIYEFFKIYGTLVATAEAEAVAGAPTTKIRRPGGTKWGSASLQ